MEYSGLAQQGDEGQWRFDVYCMPQYMLDYTSEIASKLESLCTLREMLVAPQCLKKDISFVNKGETHLFPIHQAAICLIMKKDVKEMPH
ncbi:MAG: hypothetical protein ACKO37_06980 [Vampirovibrionales bacterium]